MAADVLLVSLGSTHGWRVADAALADSMRRAGATVEVVTAEPPREVRTFALTDLLWARAARRATLEGPEARAVIYSTTTAALLAPRPGAIRFDALAAGNRPGRHGIWQRRAERRRLAGAPLLVPMSAQALDEAPARRAESVVVPVPIVATDGGGERDLAAIVYASDPVKKGLARVLDAWAEARRDGEELVVVTDKDVPAHPGVRVEDVRGEDFRALVRSARVYVVAPRREDFGIAQLEALADGCVLVTTAPAGPYVARDLARQLDPRTVGDDLATALRTALDDPAPGYAERARDLLRPFAPAAVDATVANELLPRLLRD
ncbi:MAG TPA: glycosyltransferase [Solirubrobacteraceae bacterium]|jgi:glycosyltransferase involved in cell wall biosynthesis